MISVEHIPPLSPVILQVMQLDPENPQVGIDDLEKIIKPDRGISAELLKISNSALYGRSGRIKTLREALSLLGIKMVKNIIMMLSTLSFSKGLNNPIYRKYLQEYPVVSALVTMDLCAPLGLKSLMQEGFLSGLLHKVGMSILAQHRPDHYMTLINAAENEDKNLTELEQENYMADQLEVGLLAFEVWKLPQELKDTISNMNCPSEKIGEISDLCRLTIMAGDISGRLLEIPQPPWKEERLENLFNYFHGPEDLKEKFNQDYLYMLQEHPFYEQALRV